MGPWRSRMRTRARPRAVSRRAATRASRSAPLMRRKPPMRIASARGSVSEKTAFKAAHASMAALLLRRRHVPRAQRYGIFAKPVFLTKLADFGVDTFRLTADELDRDIATARSR
jgi:hypothetical protein